MLFDLRAIGALVPGTGSYDIAARRWVHEMTGSAKDELECCLGWLD